MNTKLGIVLLHLIRYCAFSFGLFERKLRNRTYPLKISVCAQKVSVVN